MNSHTRKEDDRVKGTDRTKERIIVPQSDNSSSDSDHSTILQFISTHSDNSSCYSDQSSSLNFSVTQSDKSGSDSAHSGA